MSQYILFCPIQFPKINELIGNAYDIGRLFCFQDVFQNLEEVHLTPVHPVYTALPRPVKYYKHNVVKGLLNGVQHIAPAV